MRLRLGAMKTPTDFVMIALILNLLSNANAFAAPMLVGGLFRNSYSQLAVQDNTTTLTIVNDIEGSFEDFALVIPVPQVIPEEQQRCSTRPSIGQMPILNRA